MTNERELNLSTLVLEECLINKSQKDISDREKKFIDYALGAFHNLDFLGDKKLRSDFSTTFDNNSFPAVVDVLFKYDSGKNALTVIKAIVKVINEYIENKLNKKSDDYEKTIDFLKTVNSIYRQKQSNNLSPKSFDQNVY